MVALQLFWSETHDLKAEAGPLISCLGMSDEGRAVTRPMRAR